MSELDKAKENSVVSRQLLELESSIKELSGEILVLYERVEPVLIPIETAKKEEDLSDEQTMCPVAKRIWELKNSLIYETHRLKEMRERIQV